MITKYGYSVRHVVRNMQALQNELMDLGDNGWEVVSILEKSLPSVPSSKAQTGWIIVSKKVVK